MKLLLALANFAFAVAIVVIASERRYGGGLEPWEMGVILVAVCNGVVILGAERRGTFGRLWRLWGLWIDTKEAELRKRIASASPEATGRQEA